MTQVETLPLTLADHVIGAGPPMLLLHGGTGSHRHWVRVTPALAQHFSVHAPDLPGYGESPDVPHGLSGDGYVALAAASLGRLLPARSVHLIGFSFGGALAAGVARAWGARVERLTLIGPGGFGKPLGRDIPLRGYKDIDGSPAARREVARHNLQAMMLADPTSIDDEAIEQQLWNVAHTRYNSLRVSHRDCLAPDLAGLPCPVQVIWGAADPMAYPSPAARAERVRQVRPDARLEFVPGGSHWVQYERPDEVVRLLIDFHAPAAAPTEQR
ncbi:MAG: alpha/beta fold hydrolase [Burkholderiaceae bacterium]|nr:alpha/beta fold hydrolase [Burkholderiaceae bacterium]